MGRHTGPGGATSFTHSGQLYISIAERPSVFGYALFNAAFRSFGMNAFYKPVQVSPELLEDAVRGIRGLGVRGCGVSMPHKTAVMAYLDKIDERAERIGAINTIVNDNGVLIGHNTDYHGALRSLEEAGLGRGDRAIILGAGGVARAVVIAMTDLGMRTLVSARDETKTKSFAQQYDASSVPWGERDRQEAEALVNCTPIGMEPDEKTLPIEPASLGRFGIIGDLVAKPPITALMEEARRQGLRTIPGYRFILHQAVKQFELYTGRCDAEPIMRETLGELLGVDIR